MGNEETKQSEQGQVSSPATEPKDVNQNTYTEDETSLAAKYHVEPKLVRLLKEIVEEHFAEPEQAEEQPAEQEQPKEPCIDCQTQERLKSYYKSLEPRTKLAIATLSEIECLDGINFQARQKEGKLFNEIWSDLESVCLETFHRQPDEDIPFGITDTEDIWLTGVWEAVRMVLQNC